MGLAVVLACACGLARSSAAFPWPTPFLPAAAQGEGSEGTEARSRGLVDDDSDADDDDGGGGRDGRGARAPRGSLQSVGAVRAVPAVVRRPPPPPGVRPHQMTATTAVLTTVAAAAAAAAESVAARAAQRQRTIDTQGLEFSEEGGVRGGPALLGGTHAVPSLSMLLRASLVTPRVNRRAASRPAPSLRRRRRCWPSFRSHPAPRARAHCSGAEPTEACICLHYGPCRALTRAPSSHHARSPGEGDGAGGRPAGALAGRRGC